VILLQLPHGDDENEDDDDDDDDDYEANNGVGRHGVLKIECQLTDVAETEISFRLSISTAYSRKERTPDVDVHLNYGGGADDKIYDTARELLTELARRFKLATRVPRHIASLLAVCCIAPSVHFNFNVYNAPFLECLVRRPCRRMPLPCAPALVRPIAFVGHSVVHVELISVGCFCSLSLSLSSLPSVL
jgi:hypothetical protein